jgi:choline kinase
MRAVILAAGVGARLGGDAACAPKIMLRFDGKTLLERHLENLRACGITDIVVATGYRDDLVESELARLGVDGTVRTRRNPEFRDGSVVTLATVGGEVAYGGDVILMDADVLCDQRMIKRLVQSPHDNCFLLDRNIEAGEEPVRLCIRAGRPIEFRKNAEADCDFYGESIGFFRFTADVAGAIIEGAGRYAAQGDRAAPHEEVLRDILRKGPAEKFGYEDVSELPWVEIDFPDDIRRAREDILPQLVEATA